MAFDELIQKARAIEPEEIFRRVFDREAVKLKIIDLNTRAQLFDKGIDREGVKLAEIGGGYSFLTRQDKQARNIPVDRVTLFDEGVFYESFRVDVQRGLAIISANIARIGEENFDRFGRKMVGLTDESIAILIEFIIPFVQEEFQRAILG